MKIDESNETKEMVAKETQTDTDKNLKCMEFIFEGVPQMKWHMNQNHGWPEIVKSSQNPKSDNMNISLNSTDPQNCEKC